MPLKEDMEEVPTVYNCLLHLFSNNNPVVIILLMTSVLRGYSEH